MLLLRRSRALQSIQVQLPSIFVGIRESSSSVTESVQEEHIEIPKRIHRGPTDILQALAATVGTDPTAPHYKYHDDPYLIPTSNAAKKTFGMAQESGRKAAKWIKEEHRNLFMHSVAQPPVKAFAPKMVFTEESEVDEECLKNLIRDYEIKDAVMVYNALKSKGISISDTDKQSLLEMLCFSNNEEPISDDFIEERWFLLSLGGKERNAKTWKDGELAEHLFNEIEPKTPQTYAALIRGMCKYYQVERAYALFNEATEKQIELDTKTFNAILGVSRFLKESGDMRWDFCKDLLSQMEQRQIMPDLGTMNAILSTISSISNQKLAKTAALATLSEFKSLGIEPSLATYYYILIIFCRERGPVSHVIVDILTEIEGKEFHIEDPKDIFFFATAMDICRNHLYDKNLAKKVNQLLHTGNNYDLIGGPLKETVYYRNYLGLLCQTEPLENFMETYDLLVPNVHVPEPGIMEEILKAVDTNGALELIPRMWSDMVIFDHIWRETLLTKLLKIMTENKPNPTEIQSHDGLKEKFAIIAWDIFTRIDERNEYRMQKINLTGSMLGDILTLLSRGGEFEKAVEIFNKIDKSQQQISGTPSEESMHEFVNLCIIEKSPSNAINCLQYSVEIGLESAALATKINQGFTLNETHLSKIKSLVRMESLEDN